jgi:hypothetical protein
VSWRTGALVREAWLNVISSRWRTAGIVLAMTAILGSLAALELRDANELRSFQASFARSGGYVALGIPGSDPASAARCEAMNGQPGVVAAGAVFPAQLATLETAPGVLFQRAAITRGVLRVWDPGARVPAATGRQVVIGLALAEEMGLRAGSYAMPQGEEPALVTAVVDVARRNPQVARWLLEPAAPEGSAEQCWVEFEPGAYEAGVASLAARFTTGDEEAVARPYIRRDEFTRDPEAEFAARPQRNGWPLAGGLMAGLFALTAWFRRSELGLYLAIGTPRVSLMLMLSVEALLLVGFAFVLSVVYGFAIDEALRHSPKWSELRIVLRTAGSAALLALAVAPVLAVLVVRGSIAELLKEG